MANHTPVRTLANAPLPGTISAEARAQLDKPAVLSGATLESQRALCARVQRDLGARQRQRYDVAMSEDNFAGVPVLIFTPRARPAAEDFILLNLHGGGFSKDAGSVTENVPLAALCAATVVSVQYRMAPEHPFPAAVDDSEAVYRQLLHRFPAHRIGLYGTSAGAILCSQLLIRLQRRGCALPSALGFFSGSADLSQPGDSEHFFRPPQDLPGDIMFASYVANADRRDPQLSPSFADAASLGDFPPTLCIAGTRDFLLSQTALFHRRLLQAGVAAELVVFEAMPHAHWIYLELPESDEAFELMARFLLRRLRGSQPNSAAPDDEFRR